MENDKIRKLLDQYHRSTSPEGRAYAERKIRELGFTLAEVHQMVKMDNPYFEARRVESACDLTCPAHRHEFAEILCCMSNSGVECQTGGGERILLQRGDIVVIPAGISHSFLTREEPAKNSAGYMIWVGDEYIRAMSEVYPYFRYTGEPKAAMLRTALTPWENICELFRGIVQEAELRAVGWESAVGGMMAVLMTQLGRAAVSLGQSIQTSEKPELLESILAYVDTVLGEKITLENTAERFWVSQSTITHLFWEKMGVSFYKYVTQRRLAEAKNLIREGMSMEKVASRVGFGDYSAFYRAFKQEFGVSPRDYRNQMGGGPSGSSE